MPLAPPLLLMVGIPPIKMVMTNKGWFMALLYQHYPSVSSNTAKAGKSPFTHGGFWLGKSSIMKWWIFQQAMFDYQRVRRVFWFQAVPRMQDIQDITEHQTYLSCLVFGVFEGSPWCRKEFMAMYNSASRNPVEHGGTCWKMVELCRCFDTIWINPPAKWMHSHQASPKALLHLPREAALHEVDEDISEGLSCRGCEHHNFWTSPGFSKKHH